MNDLLIGVFLGYWLKDKIDSEKMRLEDRIPPTSGQTNENIDSSNRAAGLWLAGASLGIGLLTLLIGWYLLAFICAGTLVAGFSLMLTHPGETSLKLEKKVLPGMEGRRRLRRHS